MRGEIHHGEGKVEVEKLSPGEMGHEPNKSIKSFTPKKKGRGKKVAQR